MSKRSWPLVLLGVGAFIPGFGFMLGAVAVTWGLLSDRPRARLAVALGAAGAGFQVLIGLGFVLWLRNSPLMREAQATKAATDLAQLVAELDAYKAQTGKFPSSLYALSGSSIPTRLNIHDPTAGFFRQQPYTYRPSESGTTFDLFAIGPDGQPDTSDDIRPVLPDSLQGRTGYQPAGERRPN
jgi:hypothetical protein